MSDEGYGTEIDFEIVTLFNDMKLRYIHKYASFKIINKDLIKFVVDEELLGDPKHTETKKEDKECFDELVTKLTEEPRYILYDFGFTSKEGESIQKMAFIFW